MDWGWPQLWGSHPALWEHPHFYHEIPRYNKLQMDLVIFSLVFLERRKQTSLLNLFNLLNWFSYFQGLNRFGRRSRCCVIALSFSGAAAAIIADLEPHSQRWSSLSGSSAEVTMTGKLSFLFVCLTLAFQNWGTVHVRMPRCTVAAFITFQIFTTC